MDSIAERLKKAFGFGKQFKGPGQRLGTAEESGVKPKTKNVPTTTGRKLGNSTSEPLRAMDASEGFNPFQAAVVSGSVMSAPTVADAFSIVPRPEQRAGTSGQPSQSRPGRFASEPSSQHPPTPGTSHSTQHLSASNGLPVADEQVDAMNIALVQVASHPEMASRTLETLRKVLSNILTNPGEARFRTLRLANPKVQETVVSVDGAMEFLSAAGFELRFPQEDAVNGEGVAVFPDESDLVLVHTALQQLQQVASSISFSTGAPAPTTASMDTPANPTTAQAPQSPKQPPPTATGGPDPASAGAPQSPRPAQPAATGGSDLASTAAPAHVPSPRAPQSQGAPGAVPSSPWPRNTTVLLPVTPDTTVPDWFFQRTPADVKAEYLAMVRAREAGTALMTRAMREASGQKARGPSPQYATLRVRFPEGVCLQGDFGATEPVAAIFTWVTEALRSFEITYELILPSRKVLAPGATIRQADLMPSAILNFRVTCQLGPHLQSVPLINDELLRLAKVTDNSMP